MVLTLWLISVKGTAHSMQGSDGQRDKAFHKAVEAMSVGRCLASRIAQLAWAIWTFSYAEEAGWGCTQIGGLAAGTWCRYFLLLDPPCQFVFSVHAEVSAVNLCYVLVMDNYCSEVSKGFGVELSGFRGLQA